MNPQAPEAFNPDVLLDFCRKVPAEVSEASEVLDKLKDQPNKKGKLWAVNSLDFSVIQKIHPQYWVIKSTAADQHNLLLLAEIL